MNLSVLKGGGASPRLIVQILVVFLQLTLLYSYLLAFRLGHAPELLFFPINIHYLVIGLAGTVFLLSFHDLKWLRFVIITSCLIIAVSSIKNSLSKFSSSMYFEFILYVIFTFNIFIIISGMIKSSFIKTSGRFSISISIAITTMILLSFAILAFVMMIKYQIYYYELSYFISILVLIAFIFSNKPSCITLLVIKIIFKIILLCPFVQWGISLLSYDHSGDSEYIFLSVAFVGVISIVLDGMSFILTRRSPSYSA